MIQLVSLNVIEVKFVSLVTIHIILIPFVQSQVVYLQFQTIPPFSFNVYTYIGIETRTQTPI